MRYLLEDSYNYIIHVATSHSGQWILIFSDLWSSLIEHYHQDNCIQLRIESVAHRVSPVDQQDYKILHQTSGHPVDQLDI